MTDVPTKFRDTKTGEVRLDALLASYAELEKKLGQMVAVPGDDADDAARSRFYRALGVPESPDGYDVTFADERFAADPQVNARLHAAGLTPAQVQLVYDLAADYIGPAVERAGAEFEAKSQAERLRQHFGGEERWRDVSRQLKQWGEARLPPDVMHALCCTEEGVHALHAMMRNGEPGLGRGARETDAASEADLAKMMRDPRYWKSKDPAFVEQVTQGFQRLYPQ